MTRGGRAMSDLTSATHDGSIQRMTKTVQVTFRIDDRLSKRVERFAASIRAEYPEVSVTQSDAIRGLLARALDAFEREAGKANGWRQKG